MSADNSPLPVGRLGGQYSARPNSPAAHHDANHGASVRTRNPASTRRSSGSLRAALALPLLLTCACAEDFGDDVTDLQQTASSGSDDEAMTDAEPLDRDDSGVDELEASMDDDGLGITGAARINDTNVNPRWANVVAVTTTTGNCSGTLISPVHVLTAGHCGNGVSVRLDTPAGSGAGSIDKRQYSVVQTRIHNVNAISGEDLALLLLDRAVPSYGTEGAPGYAADPAFAFATINRTGVNWTVGYGVDCGGAAYGSRRGLMYNGGFSTYAGAPGVITRNNPGCGNPAYAGPNQGDSGGPLLDVSGRVVGVFSGWGCRDAAGQTGAPGCTGTIEWTGINPGNSAWLSATLVADFDGDGIVNRDDPRPALNCNGASPPAACASVRPDFEVVRIFAAGCTGPGGDPMVGVEVRNNGPVSASAWVDVFVDEASAPSIGDWGAHYRRSNTLAQGQTQILSFAIQPAGGSGWIDVIVDTVQSVAETNEGNNIRSTNITHANCTF